MGEKQEIIFYIICGICGIIVVFTVASDMTIKEFNDLYPKNLTDTDISFYSIIFYVPDTWLNMSDSEKQGFVYAQIIKSKPRGYNISYVPFLKINITTYDNTLYREYETWRDIPLKDDCIITTQYNELCFIKYRIGSE